MIVVTDGAKEYLLICIGVIGEVEEKWIVKVLEKKYSYRFIKRIINELVKDKLVKKTKNGLLRVTRPKGIEWLKEKSPPLLVNYMLMTNNHSFPGGELRERRRKATVKLLEHIIEKNIPINYFGIDLKTTLGRKSNLKTIPVSDVLGFSRDLSMETRSIFNGKELKPFKEQIQHIGIEDQFFFTSKLIRKEEHNATIQSTSRINSSRLYGILISKMNFYPVYYVEPDTEWYMRIENQTNIILRNIWWEKCGEEIREKEYQNSMKGSAVFYYENEDVLNKMATRIISSKKTKGISPWEIYDHAYYIPMENNIEEIVFENDFQTKIKKAIFDDNVKDDSFYDALINRNPTWEVITNDMVKLRKIKTVEKRVKEKGGEIILVAQEWQKEFLESIFDKPKIIFLDKEEVNALTKIVKGENV